MSKRVRNVYIVVAVCMLILLLFLVFPPLMFWNTPALTAIGLPVTEIVLFVDCILQCIVMITGMLVENRINKEEIDMRKRGEVIEY